MVSYNCVQTFTFAVELPDFQILYVEACKLNFKLIAYCSTNEIATAVKHFWKNHH